MHGTFDLLKKDIRRRSSSGCRKNDPESYWSQNKSWQPTLPQRNGKVGEDFTMTDLLTFARVA